ncbi:MAG: porin family protein [Bacteroidia bacterium]|nr:porin family protein [Bacteroidia bacterium]
MKNPFKGLIVFCFIPLVVHAQDPFEIDRSKLDTSKRNIKRIVNLSVYYIEQLKKKELPTSEFDAAREYLFKAEMELKEIDKIRINNAKYKLDKAFLIEAKKERDAKLTELATTPLSYFSSEEKSISIGGFVGITGGKYTQPAGILGEYHLSKNWSAGAWLGYFMEQQQIKNSFETKPTYYSVGEKNYKFNYISFGAQGKYRFFNPVHPFLGLPVKHFHLFVTAALGYNLSINRVALQNESYLQNNPSRNGLAYGVWPGIHYQMDDNLGMDLEAGFSNIGYVRFGINWRIFTQQEKEIIPSTRNTSFIK